MLPEFFPAAYFHILITFFLNNKFDVVL